MRPQFQADADLNHKIVIGLRRREPAIAFLDAGEGGVAGLSDLEVLRLAAASARIVVSHDRKTMPVHFARFILDRSSPGIIIVAKDLDIGAAIEDLLLVWAATDAAEWVNRIGFLPL